ncbi:MAG: proteasome assembly chaperone family protein [Methanomassiliicoccales archaeon]|nr:MAG: proteasome assembly chaperone family protein [Methanomassiliicoccales archaeon]
MDNILMIEKERPVLKDPIFIEGLPGVGNVGKLAADHMVEQLKGVKFADIYSKFFPPQVLVDDNGLIRLVSNELYYVKMEGQEHDLIILLGDYQGLTPEGQYELSYHMLQYIRGYNVKRIYTLGGYGVGRLLENPRVLGAATHPHLVEEMKAKGVIFSKGEPGSGIVGASGLLLGLGKNFGMEAVCLMGETSGYFVDPKGAEAVLKVLSSIVGVNVDYSALRDKAEQIDALASKLKEAEEPVVPKREDLGYIG